MPTNHDDHYEDWRLVRLGIDPDGNPVEIMRQVDAKLKALRERPVEERQSEDDKPEVDRSEEPR